MNDLNGLHRQHLNGYELDSAHHISSGSDLDRGASVLWSTETTSRGNGGGRGSTASSSESREGSSAYPKLSQREVWGKTMKDIVRAAKFSELWPGILLLGIGVSIFVVENYLALAASVAHH